jgi:hypothetical protein
MAPAAAVDRPSSAAVVVAAVAEGHPSWAGQGATQTPLLAVAVARSSWAGVGVAQTPLPAVWQ